MQIHHMDMENADFGDELLRALERDYGRSVSRIPKFESTGRYSWNITVIFTDFCLLEAEMTIKAAYPGATPHIEVVGMYY